MIPKAHKLPSGQWRCRVRVQGSDISITRSTKKSAIAEAIAVKTRTVNLSSDRSSLTLREAMNDYIDQRENILSPSSIAGYRVIARNRFKNLHNVKLRDIDRTRWQAAVNIQAKTVAPKTLKCSAMFVQSVIAEYTGIRLSAAMPQVVPRDLPWLSPDQIPIFLKAIRGNKYEIPALLALEGLRYSEIVALKWDDINLNAGEISVTGAAVIDENRQLVFKETNKNSSSRRTVHFIIPQLSDAVESAEKKSEYIYPKYSNVLRTNINKLCRAAGLPEVGVHGLRRSFASLCYHLRMPEAITMIEGGWSDPNTMRKIYTKISEHDIRTNAERLNAYFDHEMTT